MVSEVVPAEPPAPALSNVTTRQVDPGRVGQRRVPVVGILAEVLEQGQRRRILAAAGVSAGVVDAVGSTD